MFYKICPVCGARIEPSERCDCMDFCPPPDSYAVPRRAVLEA